MGRVLITGGAGFIGSTLAKTSQKNGWSVRVLDNLSTGLQQTADDLRELGMEVIIGDVRDEDLMSQVSKGCDAVVHLAAQVSVPLSIKNPSETMDINIHGTKTVIKACLENNVDRMVVASSAAVYGDAQNLPLDEDDAGAVLSPYAESKFYNEFQILDARKNGLKATALRFFNVYGAGQRPDGAYAAVIPKFAEMMANGMAPRLNGDGLHTRDFVHVSDVCAAIMSLMTGEWKASKYHVYNVATETKISLLDLVDSLNDALKRLTKNHARLIPTHGPEREGDIRHSMASIQRISSTLGWKPVVSFQDGIDEIVRERLMMA